MKFALLPDSLTRDLDRAIQYALLWGLDALELRMIGESRVPDVNEEKLRRRLTESELELASIQPGIFEGALSDRPTWMNDIAELPEALAFCERVGCKTIIVSAFHDEEREAADPNRATDALRRLSDAAANREVRIAVLNEPDSFAPTGSRLAGLLEEVDRPNVAAAWNPVTALKAGEDAVDGTRMLNGRIALVRCSDVRRGKDGSWKQVALGEGNTRWRAVMEALPNDFDGAISLESFAEPAKKQAVRDSSWLIRTWREVSKK